MDENKIIDRFMAEEREIEYRLHESLRGAVDKIPLQLVEEELSSSDEFWQRINELKIAIFSGNGDGLETVRLMDLIKSITEDLAIDSIQKVEDDA